jgi:vacuolar-type H+-ATPase subunit E/Vma4
VALKSSPENDGDDVEKLLDLYKSKEKSEGIINSVHNEVKKLVSYKKRKQENKYLLVDKQAERIHALYQKYQQVLRHNASSRQFTYKKLIKGLKNNEFQKIVVVTGPGVSKSAGVPDFGNPEGEFMRFLEQ